MMQSTGSAQSAAQTGASSVRQRDGQSFVASQTESTASTSTEVSSQSTFQSSVTAQTYVTASSTSATAGRMFVGAQNVAVMRTLLVHFVSAFVASVSSMSTATSSAAASTAAVAVFAWGDEATAEQSMMFVASCVSCWD